jgi:cytochrome b
VRTLPALLQRLALRPAAADPAAPAVQLAALRLEARRDRRRRDALTLGAALLLAGLIWLASARPHAWLGWALLGAGAIKLAYGLWR